MEPLAAPTLLRWSESRTGLGPAARALELLFASFPDHPRGQIADAPLSVRDRALLAVRAASCGRVLQAVERCSECGEVLELRVTAEDFGLGNRGDDPFRCGEGRSVQLGSVAVRPVSGADLAVAEGAGDPGAAAQIILDRVAPGASDREQVSEVLEGLDPAADIRLDLLCPGCGARQARDLDVARFVVAERDQVPTDDRSSPPATDSRPSIDPRLGTPTADRDGRADAPPPTPGRTVDPMSRAPDLALSSRSARHIGGPPDGIEAAPTIDIQIGRIEVQAPPAPRPPTRPRRPLPSLADHLARRGR